jgi:hypothetical protein
LSAMKRPQRSSCRAPARVVGEVILPKDTLNAAARGLVRRSRAPRLLHPRGAAWLVIGVSLGLACATAEAADSWRPSLDMDVLERVTLRVNWYESAAALRKAVKNNGHDVNEIGLRGFSVLRRNTKTGEYVCDLFVVRVKGARVDDARTLTFGHEVLHCFGLRHE